MGLLPSRFSGRFSCNSRSWLQSLAKKLNHRSRERETPPSCEHRASLHFDFIDLSGQSSGAQTFSAALHVLVLATLLFAIASVPKRGPLDPLIPLDRGKQLLNYIPPLNPLSTGRPSLGSNGSGGGREKLPTRFGELAPGSSMPLVPPRMNRDEDPALSVPPAIFDPNAPTNASTVTHLGLPWMSVETDSAGPGKGRGFGDGDGDTMGDGNGPGAGMGDNDGPYANLVSPVTCLYCPEPGYTEEARKAKLQGKLLLEVLVGTDGKAMRIRVLKGLGMGLDERALEAVRAWRFSPGRDALKHPVPAWVTIETHFQLF